MKSLQISAAPILFLLLLLLLNTAQGNCLEERFRTSSSKIVEEDNLKGGGRGWSRKMMMINTREEAMAPSIKVKDHAAVLKEEQSTEIYPDMFDLAGMDYSPAKRKSPIHN